MGAPAQRNWNAASVHAKSQWLGKEGDVMFLSLFAAAAIGLPQPEVWRKLEPPQLEIDRVGGGQSWISPPGIRRCRQERFTCAVITLRQGDTKTGVAELQASAREGDVRAMRALGLMLVRGEGVRQDEPAAVGYFYEAALRGDKESMRVLGIAFERGIGVTADPKLSQYWIQRAAAR
jgi:TPR repeat protein